MGINSIIQSLNLTEGEVLTLEKMADRMEFEAFAGLAETRTGDCTCLAGIYLPMDCPFKGVPCDCDGPVGYINCHPYKG